MHLFDAKRGFMGGHGIVGGHVPLAAGLAFASKYKGSDQVCVCFFGEAAVNIGAFHETLNMASVWKLPVIFLCENIATAWGRRSSASPRSPTSSNMPAATTWRPNWSTG